MTDNVTISVYMREFIHNTRNMTCTFLRCPACNVVGFCQSKGIWYYVNATGLYYTPLIQGISCKWKICVNMPIISTLNLNFELCSVQVLSTILIFVSLRIIKFICCRVSHIFFHTYLCIHQFQFHPSTHPSIHIIHPFIFS